MTKVTANQRVNLTGQNDAPGKLPAHYAIIEHAYEVSECQIGSEPK
jgi:hypothetical protein